MASPLKSGTRPLADSSLGGGILLVMNERPLYSAMSTNMMLEAPARRSPRDSGFDGLSPAERLERRRYESVTTGFVRVALVATGFNFVVFRGITAGMLMALASIPLWIGSIRRYTLGVTISALAFLSIPSGYLLAQRSAVDHIVDQVAQTTWFWLLLSGVAALALVLWARERLPLHEVILLYAIGAVANAVLFSARSWKFDLAVPVILLVLSIVERQANRMLPVFAVLALGLYSVINDGRSLLGFCALAAMLTMWQIPSVSSEGGRRSRWKPALVVGAAAVGFYMVVSSMLTAGVFGAELQQRSVAQVESSGSLIAGGRPEWSATRELLKLRPMGYGTGVVPGWQDVRAGKAGFQSINVEADGYIERFLLGKGFELHSIVSDLWVSFGWVGVALAGVMLVAFVRSMAFRLSDRDAPTSVLFACTLGIWYLMFGTIYGNWLEVCVALGFGMVPRLVPDSVDSSGPDSGLGHDMPAGSVGRSGTRG